MKQSKQNAENTKVSSDVGNGEGADWSTENVMLSSRVIGGRRRVKEKNISRCLGGDLR